MRASLPALALLVSSVCMQQALQAKSLKDKLGVTENGVMQTQAKIELKVTVEQSIAQVDQQRYTEIVSNPEAARDDHERMVALAAREVYILIDRSGSMISPDRNPTSRSQGFSFGGFGAQQWSRWDSARFAARSVIDVALTLDADARVEVVLWDGNGGNLRCEKSSARCMQDIDELFSTHQPGGGTPLAAALQDLYDSRLRHLFERSEPATVLVFTDGAPDDQEAVRYFFKSMVRESRMLEKGRETLAAFSFVQMGDDAGADKFLRSLDDNFARELGVDIIDTKKDDFLFGTGQHSYGPSGPFALLWDAIYD